MMSKCFQELYFYFQQCLSGLCTEIIRQSTHKISKRNINNSTMMIKSLRYIGTVKCTKCKSDRPTLIKKNPVSRVSNMRCLDVYVITHINSVNPRALTVPHWHRGQPWFDVLRGHVTSGLATPISGGRRHSLCVVYTIDTYSP